MNYKHHLTLLDSLALRDNELKTWLKFMKVERIARLSQVPIPFVRKILEKFERLGYVINTPAKTRKHPSKLIKEFLQSGKHPDIYEYVEKEYRIARKGSDQFYSWDKDQFQEGK